MHTHAHIHTHLRVREGCDFKRRPLTAVPHVLHPHSNDVCVGSLVHPPLHRMTLQHCLEEVEVVLQLMYLGRSRVGGEGRRKTREGREVQGKVELGVKVRLP